MDYPISVPSIGLVGGKFVDEYPLVGTPGSLIPAQWGNAVTDEILHVITGAGLVPDEDNNTQLLAAIKAVVPQSGVAPGRLLGVRVYSTAGSFTYNPTLGTNSVIVDVQGAGGGGGGVAATGVGSVSVSGGGGSGSYATSRLTAGFSGVAVTVGAAGAAGAAGLDGGAGGTSSFGALISCPGGTPGGSTGATAVTPPASRGGSIETAVPSGGNIYSSRGKPGGGSTSINGVAGIVGQGASSRFGGGGIGVLAAGSYGAGGGGVASGYSTVASVGGLGGPGIVIVWEYA